MIVAGTRDVLDADDPWAALEGRSGGVLAVFSREDGGKLWEQELPAPPVLDGIAVTGEGVFLALEGGSVVRFSGDATR